jgi:hypothetical protein
MPSLFCQILLEALPPPRPYPETSQTVDAGAQCASGRQRTDRTWLKFLIFKRLLVWPFLRDFPCKKLETVYYLVCLKDSVSSVVRKIYWNPSNPNSYMQVRHRNGQLLESFFPEPLGWGTSVFAQGWSPGRRRVQRVMSFVIYFKIIFS